MQKQNNTASQHNTWLSTDTYDCDEHVEEKEKRRKSVIVSVFCTSETKLVSSSPPPFFLSSSLIFFVCLFKPALEQSSLHSALFSLHLLSGVYPFSGEGDGGRVRADESLHMAETKTKQRKRGDRKGKVGQRCSCFCTRVCVCVCVRLKKFPLALSS